MKQDGTILAIVLILLAVLTLLGLTSLTVSQLEMRMSNNTFDNIEELQAAEAGLRAGENVLSENPQADEFIKRTQGAYPSIKDLSYGKLNYFGVAVNYSLEQFPISVCLTTVDHKVWRRNFYRVTAWASRVGNNPVILQSTYAITQEMACDPIKTINNEDIHERRMSWSQLE